MATSVAPVAARHVWLDYAKAIGIVLVVLGHANRSIASSGMDWSEALRLTDRLIYSFHMPLFFVLAGYASTLSRRRDWTGFLVGTWWGVAFPYLLGSVLWVAAKSAAPSIANVPISSDALLNILWTPIQHLWFLHHLLVARVLWFIVDPQSAPRLGWAALAAVGVATIFWHDPIVAYIAFYGVGAMLIGGLMRIEPRMLQMAGGVALLLWLLLVFLPSETGQPVRGSMSSLAGAIVLICLVRGLPEPTTPAWRTVGFVGEASLVIYLLHLYFATAARVILNAVGLLSPATLLVAGTVAGLLGPLLVHVLLLRLVARTGWRLPLWLGLGTLVRSSYFDFSPPKLGHSGAASTERL